MQRSIISLVAGILLAVVAVALLYNYVTNLQPSTAAAPAVNVTSIVVADDNLAFGTELEAANLSLVRWPADSVPEGAFLSIDEVFAGGDETGRRVTLVPITPGEPVLRSKISGFGQRPIMSRQVADGMRALSVRIDDVSGVAGFVLPGDRVDILLTRNNEDTNNMFVTDVVLQNIVVLGIDQSADQTTDQPVVARTATVEVTPEQAQRLALAQRAGTLSLSLRNVETIDEVPVVQVDERDLSTRRPVAAGGGGPTVRVRGSDGTVVSRTVRP